VRQIRNRYHIVDLMVLFFFRSVTANLNILNHLEERGHAECLFALKEIRNVCKLGEAGQSLVRATMDQLNLLGVLITARKA